MLMNFYCCNNSIRKVRCHWKKVDRKKEKNSMWHLATVKNRIFSPGVLQCVPKFHFHFWLKWIYYCFLFFSHIPICFPFQKRMIQKDWVSGEKYNAIKIFGGACGNMSLVFPCGFIWKLCINVKSNFLKKKNPFVIFLFLSIYDRVALVFLLSISC